MKNWRCEGWDKQFHGLRVDTTRYSTAPQTFEGIRLMSNDERIVYEAGADAGIEALATAIFDKKIKVRRINGEIEIIRND